MKTLIVFFAAFILTSLSVAAQEVSKGGGKIAKNNASLSESKEDKTPSDKTHRGRWASRDEQRRHAEKMSNGHAFSGKGKGESKNISDPEKKGKGRKAKKDKTLIPEKPASGTQTPSSGKG